MFGFREQPQHRPLAGELLRIRSSVGHDGEVPTSAIEPGSCCSTIRSSSASVCAAVSARWVYSAWFATETGLVVGASREGGMRVVFDPALDGTGWPGVVGERGHATAGEAWLGPQGLLGRLELELGLTARQASPIERAADLSRLLAGVNGYWARSFEVDPIATAHRLLVDRDALATWGWSGERTTERLDSLWRVTEPALAGVPDRLRRVIAILDRRRLAIASIRVVDAISQLSPLWQQVFARLACRGVQIEHVPLPVIEAHGDLGAARHTPFTPTGDGTLQLLRSHGPLAAADEVAGAIAAADDLDGLVIVGADALLDAAFVRHGLPSVGADVPTPACAAVVRLCVESAFRPMATADLHALLCLDPGPIPRGVAWALLRALGTFPARDSHLWRDALAAGLALVEDAETRAGLAQRVASLVDPIADREGKISLEQLAERMTVLACWARGRGVHERSLVEVAARAEQLVAVARLCGASTYARSQLLRLCDELERVVVDGPPADHGLAAIHGPAAMLGPARVVVWWGFTRDRAPRIPRIRLTNGETAALAAAGVKRPDAGIEMAHEARRWRRALELTSEAMVMVCPYTDAVGDRAHPHPLWDALVAAMPDPKLAARVSTPRMTLRGIGAPRTLAAARTTPAAFTTARTPSATALAPEESASNIELLLGCSLAYALRQVGKLRPRMAARPTEPSPLLYGNLAHHLLELVFGVSDPAATTATARAEEVFDREVPRLAEAFALPDYQAERTNLRRAFVESVRLLATVLEQTGASSRGLEVPLAGSLAGVRITARADLVLDVPFHVIDFKWGGASHRERLRSGTAVQLAIYAALVRGEGMALPSVAYLTLRDQRLLATRGSGLAIAEEMGSHTVGEMLGAVERALEIRIHELSDQRLTAPGAGVEDAGRSRIVDGMLRLAPPCQYCDLDGLCGRRGAS